MEHVWEVWCGVYGEARVFSVEVKGSEKVSALQEAIGRVLKTDAPWLLKLYLARDGNKEWLKDDYDVEKLLQGPIDTTYPQLRSTWRLHDTELFGTNPPPSEETVHVLVELPNYESVISNPIARVRRERVVWFGHQECDERTEADDPHLLPRTDLTTKILRRLDKIKLLLVKGPPRTGKSSLVKSVCQSLVQRSTDNNEMAAVFSLSALRFSESVKFTDFFKASTGVDWNDAVRKLPSDTKCMVYLVVDNAHVIIKDGRSAPTRDADLLWILAKYILNDAAYRVRIVMFAAYCPSVVYTREYLGIQLTGRSVMGLERLNFNASEVDQYVAMRFVGVSDFSASDKDAFCSLLMQLTGGHVGLCAEAINKLNEVHSRSGSASLSSCEWLQFLQRALDGDENDALYTQLTASSAVSALNLLDPDELDPLESVAFGSKSTILDDAVSQCVKSGILVETQDDLAFSSPIMARFFLQKRASHIVRALHAPASLPDLINRAIRAIDYRVIGDRSRNTNISLEHAWQMELYHSLRRCTPASFVTSVDVSAMFGSSGSIEFMIRCGSVLWGVELLREGTKLAEHAAQGRYASTSFNDFCVVDFRSVALLAAAVMDEIAEDLRHFHKLMVVCWEDRKSRIVLFDATMDPYECFQY